MLLQNGLMLARSLCVLSNRVVRGDLIWVPEDGGGHSAFGSWTACFSWQLVLCCLLSGQSVAPGRLASRGKC